MRTLILIAFSFLLVIGSSCAMKKAILHFTHSSTTSWNDPANRATLPYQPQVSNKSCKMAVVDEVRHASLLPATLSLADLFDSFGQLLLAVVVVFFFPVSAARTHAESVMEAGSPLKTPLYLRLRRIQLYA